MYRLPMYSRVVPCARKWLFLFTAAVFGAMCFYRWSSHRLIRNRGISVKWSKVNAQHQSLTSRYVTLCRARLNDSHRTGNHLFLLAGVVYAAQLTGRTVSMPTDGWTLDNVFNLNGINRYPAGPNCPCHEFTHPPAISYHGDDHLDTEEGRAALQQDRNRTLALCGLYQTYRYADAVAPTLRRLLRFRPEVLALARKIIDVGRPPDWGPGSYTRVGLHIRRGDFLDRHWVQYGLTVVDRRFVNHAVDYFTSKFARVQLVVASDDPSWIGNVLREKYAPASSRSTSGFTLITSSSVAVTLSRGQPPAVDLALLAICDATIVSTGSFGWWAAWLANRTTVYYDRWSRVGSLFSREFNHHRYFPPRWIPIH